MKSNEKTIGGLPVYYIDFDPEEEFDGLSCVSLVDDPAIEQNFMTFSDQKPIKLSVDETKHIVSGPALIPDLPIYRNGGYYIVFTKEVIEKLVLKYSKDGLLNTVSLQHDGENVQNVTMIESWFVDHKRGLVPEGYDLPDGTWMVSYKIEDEKLWNEIQTSGELNGFSVEVYAEMVSEMSKEQTDDEWLEELVNSVGK